MIRCVIKTIFTKKDSFMRLEPPLFRKSTCRECNDLDDSSAAALLILVDPNLHIVIRRAGYWIDPARDQNVSFRPIRL